MLKRTAKPGYGKTVRRAEEVADLAARRGDQEDADRMRHLIGAHVRNNRTRTGYRRGRGFLKSL